MAYIIEISRRELSLYAEDHRCSEGDRDCCDGSCRYPEGDAREIWDHGTSVTEMDSDDWEEHGDPVTWAAWYLSEHHPEITESFAGMTETFDSQWRSSVPEHAWLSGTSDDPYKDQVTETTVWLKGEFDTYQRSKVFALVVLPYERMLAELRERA